MRLLVAFAFFLGLIWLVPADPVGERTYFTCSKAPWVIEQERESSRAARTSTPFNSNHTGPYTADDEPLSVETRWKEKSGLRRAIEGRLKWLGLPSDMRFLDRTEC